MQCEMLYLNGESDMKCTLLCALISLSLIACVSAHADSGRAIFVRFVISDITPASCRFEQAFSGDGGKTWEVNWIATDTRVNDESHKTD